MATIIFAVLPLTGAVNASLKLAKELKARGHSVYYLGQPDSESSVLRHQFDFVPVFGKWFPPGFAAENTQIDSMTGWRRLLAARKVIARCRAFLDAVIRGEEREFLEVAASLKPDLMVITLSSEEMAVTAMLAHAAGIRSVYLNDTLGCHEDPSAPPIATAMLPGNSPWAQIKIAGAWKRRLFSARWTAKLLAALGIGIDWQTTWLRLAEKYAYPSHLLETTDVVDCRPKLLDIVACPREFDFPREPSTGRHYIEASIDLEREQEPFPWEALDGDSPLVYCAMGTLAWFPKDRYIRFFQTVINASALWPHRQWVLAVGDGLAAEDFHDVPGNVIITRRAPQLELLKRAELMINHGGTNTLKECIYFGVPMVVFPLGADHPGNAARVVHHGLGIRGELSKLSVPYLRLLIGSALANTYFHSQMAVMRDRFREMEQAKRGVKLLEMLAHA